MKYLLTGIILFFFCHRTFSQIPSLDWAKQIEGGTSSDRGYALTLCGVPGYFYCTGSFENTSDFDGEVNPNNWYSLLSSAGSNDIYVTWRSNGNNIWAKKMGGPGDDCGLSVAADDLSNVYTTGYFNGMADFNPNAGSFNLTSAGNSDIFISKLNWSGSFIWAKRIGGNGDDIANFISLDASANVYTTGSFQGIVDFKPGSGTYNLASAGADDIFILKLDSAGQFLWAKRIGGTGNENSYSLSRDIQNNIYVTGTFEGTVDFDPGTGNYFLTSNGTSDIFVCKLDSSGNFIWAKNMGGADSDGGKSVVTGNGGKIYITGWFENSVDFDPGIGSYNLTSFGDSDVFVCAFDTSGTFNWARQIGGPGTDYATGITFSIDSIYITGCFKGTADFNPGGSMYNLTSYGGYDGFICKLDSYGNFVWATKSGGANDDFSNAILSNGKIFTTGYFRGDCYFSSDSTYRLRSAGGCDDIFIAGYDRYTGVRDEVKQMGVRNDEDGVCLSQDVSGNIYLAGYFSGTADFMPGPSTNYMTSNGLADIFVSKIDASGNFLWSKAIGGNEFDAVTAIANDPSGNVYITGYFKGTVDFNPGTGTFNLTSAGDSDIFVTKLNTSGDFAWAKRMGGPNRDIAYSIRVGASGDVYTTGWYQDSADFDPDSSAVFNLTMIDGFHDIFISKLDSSGNFVWAKAIHGSNPSGWGAGYSIALDKSGNENVLITGRLDGTADFDPGPGTYNLSGFFDIFILKLDSSGAFVWAKIIDGIGYCQGNAITTDKWGNVYTTGNFDNYTDFDPGIGVYYLLGNGTDIFILKLDSSGNFVWAKSAEGGAGDIGSSITTDASGNVYSTGIFQSTADFDPGTGTYFLTSFGRYDIFVWKLDSSGNFNWAINLGGDDDNFGRSVLVDSSGNIYTTGRFRDSCDFDQGAGALNYFAAGDFDVFIHKMNQLTTIVSEHNLPGNFSVFPNPTHSELTINAENLPVRAQVNVSNMFGQVILEKSYLNTKTYKLNINSFPSGIYMLTIKSDSNTKSFKVVKL